jgi:hypothetical protein
MDQEYLKRLGLSIARGVPQMATGFVDLAALPFTMTGLLEPEQAFGSTAYLTSKGLLPPEQTGLLNETTEMVSSALNPAGALKGGLLALGTMAGAKGSKSINKAIKTAQDEAMEVAQKNAALPVEQGGLGLPPDNTAMDRARAMGFDTDRLLYHGTNADISDFRLGIDSPGHTTGAQASQSVFMTPDPVNASGWALAAQSRPDPYIDSLFRAVDNKKLPKAERAAARKALKEHMAKSYVSGKTVYPVHIRPGETTTYDMKGKSYRDVPTGKQPDALVNKSKKKGGDTVVIENMYDPPVPGWGGPWNATQVSVNDPKNIRSRFAAFDPMKRNLPDILAGLGATGIGLGLLAPQLEEEQF